MQLVLGIEVAFSLPKIYWLPQKFYNYAMHSDYSCDFLREAHKFQVIRRTWTGSRE